ncbi:MAG: undecaprenyldiphospho-muramoylpentapeptide beta-N-acetylglucosaminyltransferase [Desulfuromonadales bacterium]|nr:undecaprenyldiphospho-muramoylpentapeptide beta-N-acetylglucosaminyltransferase [Desulfuromonadales bacterium]
MKLLIAGGGTGGHLFPGIAVAEEFLSRAPENTVVFVGTEQGIESKVLPKLGYELKAIPASGIKGKSLLSKVKALGMLLYGYSESRKILKELKPDLILGVGGYVSAPALLAARGMQIPRFIHEQNAIPGVTNKLLSRFVDEIFISFEESLKFFHKDRAILTGNPLRKQITEDVAIIDGERDGRFHILVFGGSLGASRINKVMAEAASRFSSIKDMIAIKHQTGEKDIDEVKRAYESAGIDAEVVNFIDNMAEAYRAADLVICRAGATTIAEITASGKPAIFIPFPYATDDHQRRNAEALLKQDACGMILEVELTPEILFDRVKELIDNPEALKAMGENARKLAHLDAAEVIVSDMLKVCSEKGVKVKKQIQSELA